MAKMDIFSFANSVEMWERKPLKSKESVLSKVMSLKNFSSKMGFKLVPSLAMTVTSFLSLIIAKISSENFGTSLNFAMMYLLLSTLNWTLTFFLNSLNFTYSPFVS